MSEQQEIKGEKITLYFSNELIMDTPQGVDKRIAEASTNYEKDGISFYFPLPKGETSKPQCYFKYTISTKKTDRYIVPPKEFELRDQFDQSPFALVATSPFFQNPELTFRLYNPIYLNDKGFYVLFYGDRTSDSQFKRIALEYFLTHYPGKAQILPTKSLVMVSDKDPNLNAFREEVYQALVEDKQFSQGKTTEELIEAAIAKADELWKDMSPAEKSIYEQKDLYLKNVFPDQLLDVHCITATQEISSGSGGQEGGKDSNSNTNLRQDLHIIDATIVTTNSLEKEFIQYLSERSKLVESTNHLSLYASDNPSNTPPLTSITVTTNKINCTRKQFGDIFDLFVLKPYKAEYVEHSYRKVAAHFLVHPDVKEEIKRVEEFTQVFKQIGISTQNDK